MSLKEFDYKQFLLEKGERVGLGVAVALMVLMLILSLFMPEKGFNSGSPAAKAKELNTNTDQLDTLLRTKEPGPNDLPGKDEGRLIKLDTAYLDPSYFKTQGWFEPVLKEDKMRRPPKILNVEEAVAEVAKVPIDTYRFRFDNDSVKVLVLKKGAGGGANNQLRFRGGGMPGLGSNPIQQQFQRQSSTPFRLGPFMAGGAAAENPEYEPSWYPAENWDPQSDLTARQPQPLRMTVICGSFPYHNQLIEHKKKLKLPSLEAVLGEKVGKGDKEADGFRFIGVEVQRMEVDAAGNKINDWMTLPLKDDYHVWLKYTFLPPEPEDPKYSPIRILGLCVPLLREFHTDKAAIPGLQGGGMLLPGFGLPGMQPRLNTTTTTEEEKPKTKYTDLVEKLPKLQKTMEDLNKVDTNKIATPKFRPAEVADLFNLDAAPSNNAQNSATAAKDNNAGQDSVYPEHVLVRVVDVHDVQPGKFYRYRLRIKMANPNYERKDVAAPAYKEKEELTSDEWFDNIPIVSVPPEVLYYVVDEAQGVNRRNYPPRQTAQGQLWNERTSADQVIFQFHRWVDKAVFRDSEVPIGDWVIADRVPVSRGEYVGRKVKVDVPIWQSSRNAFILPTDDKTKVKASKKSTGIEMDFSQEPPENNMILVDFEGGKASFAKVVDESILEVLLLSPDGKMLARNNYADTANGDRQKNRDEVLKRIQETREGRGTE